MYVPLYEAVRDFFRTVQWAGNVVPVVYAGPNRAHQEWKRILAKREAGREGVADTEQAMEDRPVPVPFMSLLITPPKYAERRFNPSRVIISKDVAAGTAQVARFMHPVDATIQVDLWCGNAGGDMIAMSIEPQVEQAFFGGHRALYVDWSDRRWYRPPFNVSEHVRYFGRTGIVLYSEGWEDTSDLETGEGPKEVRRTWRGRLEAYIPFKLEEARIVRSVPIDVGIGLSPEATEAVGTVYGGVED